MAGRSAARVDELEVPGYESWPHPKPSLVDPRLVAVIERALGGTVGGRRRAVIVAEAVWDWLAEGDET